MPVKINASDVKSWKHCPRRLWYDYHLPEEEAEEFEEDAFEALIQQLGLEHEKSIRDALGEFVEPSSVRETQELIVARAPVIYQPMLENERLFGQPDFLILNDEGQYQVADAKLAESLKRHPEVRIQLSLYRMLLGTDTSALAFLGNGEVEEVGEEADKERDKFLKSVSELLEKEQVPETHFSESKCSVCPYDELCRPKFLKEQELTLAYGLDARSAPGLRKQGIQRLGDLAAKSVDEIQDVPYLKGPVRKKRLIAQAQSFVQEEIVQVEPFLLPEGTWIHFDVEANPLSQSFVNQVYLWGFIGPPYQKDSFEHVWSYETEHGDYEAWSEFLTLVERYRSDYPDLVLAHYSRYEVQQIKTYAARYEMEQHPTVAWLLGEQSPLYDLLPVIQQSLALPLLSYSLKRVCKDKRLVNFQWELQESGSQWSVIRYLDYLDAEDPNEADEIRNEILSYNRDDVLATRALEVWLRNF